MPRILVLLAHPALQTSRLNRRFASAVRELEGVRVHDLYEEYPDYFIDVPREQALLLEHDVIVFQHPLYWYSCPALLKEWLDLVLEYGFAYGPGGTSLTGKSLLTAITAGGSERAYQPGGYNTYTIPQLLTPFDQTARLCGMTYLPPVVVHQAGQLTDEEIEAAAQHYQRTLLALRDGAPTPVPPLRVD